MEPIVSCTLMTDEPSNVWRRTYLRTMTGIATAGMVGVAGCQGLDETAEDAAQTNAPENESQEDGTAEQGGESDEETTGESENGSDEETADEAADGSDEETADDPENGSNEDPVEPIDRRIDVVHAVGHVSSAETVTMIELTVMKSPGSDVVDLSALTLEFSDDTADTALSHGGNGKQSDASVETFVTTYITGEGSHDELVSTGDRVTIAFDASLVRGDDGLPPGSNATVTLVDRTGAQNPYDVSVPATLRNGDVVLV